MAQKKDQNDPGEEVLAVGRRQEGQGQGGIISGSRKGDTVAAADVWALVMVFVAVDALVCEEEGVAEDLATAREDCQG